MNVDHLTNQEYSLTHRSTLIGLQIIQRMGNAKQSSYFHQQGQMFSSMVLLPNLNPGLNGPCQKNLSNSFYFNPNKLFHDCQGGCSKILQTKEDSSKKPPVTMIMYLLMWIHTYKHTYSYSLSSVKFCLDFVFPEHNWLKLNSFSSPSWLLFF